MELLVLVLACFVAAALAPGIFRVLRYRVGYLLALVPAAVAAYLATWVPAVATGHVVESSLDWLPALGVSLSLRLDGLGLMMGLLITVIGAFVSLYAGSYLRGNEHQGRFFLYLYLFMGAMLGLVLADDLIALFVFWELTSISSYFLIGFNASDETSRRSALQALLVTGIGGLALLAGLILLGVAAGATTLSEVNAAGHALHAHILYLPVLVLVLAGCFTKSAQFPFHFWLPNAMAAPSPVSAYLHSATMVKAGIYLMARLHPSLGGTTAWTVALMVAGLATFAVGTIMALRQTDLKRILAYTTVASLGFLTLLLGVGTVHAIEAAMAFLLAHALYKGALFLVAGIVDHEAGSRDIRLLGGLRKAMPLTALAAAAAGLSFMGIPPLLGFIAKEVALDALLEGPAGIAVTAVVTVLLVGSFLAAYLAAFKPFWGAKQETPKHAHEAPLTMLAGPLVLAGAGLLFGLWSALPDRFLVSPAASIVVGQTVHAHLVLWHGINAPLLLSIAIVITGVLILWRRVAFGPWLENRLAPLDARGAERGYDASVNGMLRFAAWQTRILQHGNLRGYLALIAGVLVAGLVALLLRSGAWTGLPTVEAVAFHEAFIAMAMVAAALYITITRRRLAAIAALGVVGYGVALVFILFGAPDLAMTQFLFETLSVLLFVLVLLRMPDLHRRSTRSTLVRDGILAGAFGLVMTTIALAVMGVRIHEPVSRFFAEQSYLAAHGRNVVNVILVDFRALDTLGEVIVIVVAAVGVYALLRARRNRQSGDAAAGEAEAEEPGSRSPTEEVAP